MRLARSAIRVMRMSLNNRLWVGGRGTYYGNVERVSWRTHAMVRGTNRERRTEMEAIVVFGMVQLAGVVVSALMARWLFQ
jgi:hypothetical protein